MLVLPRERAGVSVEVPKNLDPTRRCGRVHLCDVAVTADDILPRARDSALARARTLLAAEAVGGAADCVDAAVAYAKVRQQFGRTIATFQAVKHHCANMLVAAESAIAAVWDAARAVGADEQQFRLAAAVAAALAFPAYTRNAELNIQVHGGIGFTWEHDAHLHLRRALVSAALLGGDAPADDVFELTAAGVTRENSLDLPAEAEELRTQIRADAAEIAHLDPKAQLDKLIETGYVMPHWPKPWGRAANAVEQLVIDEEFREAGVKRPDYSITGWVILTLIQHGTPWQVERFVAKALRQEEIWCQLFSEPEAGSDATSVKTRHQGRRWLEDQRAEGVDQRGAVLCAWPSHRAHRPGCPQARRHHHGDHRHEGTWSRSGHCARSPVARNSTRCSSTTSSFPTRTSSGRPTCGRSRGRRWATSGSASAAAVRSTKVWQHIWCS